MNRTLAIAGIMLLLLATVPSTYANTGSDSWNYKMALNNDHIYVALKTKLDQNLTSLPVFSFVLQGENSSQAAEYIASSIRTTTPASQVSELVLRAVSNGSYIDLDLSFKLLGVVSTDPSGAASARVEWRSFKVEEDLIVNGTGLNLVGKHYLSRTLLDRVQSARSPTPQIRVTFKLDGSNAIPSEIERIAPELNLLDFTPLSAPLDSWEREFTLLPMATTWTRESGFDVLVTIIISEPLGEQLRIEEKVKYEVLSAIEAPGFAGNTGNTVSFGQTLFEPIMSGIILITSLVFVGSYTIERRVTGRRKRGSRGR